MNGCHSVKVLTAIPGVRHRRVERGERARRVGQPYAVRAARVVSAMLSKTVPERLLLHRVYAVDSGATALRHLGEGQRQHAQRQRGDGVHKHGRVHMDSRAHQPGMSPPYAGRRRRRPAAPPKSPPAATASAWEKRAARNGGGEKRSGIRKTGARRVEQARGRGAGIHAEGGRGGVTLRAVEGPQEGSGKGTMQPCLIHPHAISLVRARAGESQPAPKAPTHVRTPRSANTRQHAPSCKEAAPTHAQRQWGNEVYIHGHVHMNAPGTPRRWWRGRSRWPPRSSRRRRPAAPPPRSARPAGRRSWPRSRRARSSRCGRCRLRSQRDGSLGGLDSVEIDLRGLYFHPV